jgi:hypothetical protein
VAGDPGALSDLPARRTQDDLPARVDHLMVDVLVDDEHERMDELRARLSPDLVDVGPDAVLDSADAVSQAFAATALIAAWRSPCIGAVRSTCTTAGSGTPGREWSGARPPWKAGPSARSTTPARFVAWWSSRELEPGQRAGQD